MLQPIENAFTQPLLIQPIFSRSFAVFMLCLHSIALSILLTIAYIHTDIITQLFMFGFSIAVVISGWNSYRQIRYPQHHQLYNSRLVIVQQEADDKLVYQEYLLLHTGQRAIIMNNSYAHPLLVILNIKPIHSNRLLSLIIWNNMLDKDTFRRLRVRVKYPFYPRPNLNFTTWILNFLAKFRIM